MATAFIIGNGTSRAGVDLARLKPKGTVFGCNAICREFHPHYIVAIDDPMIKHLSASDYPQHRILIPPEPERFELTGSGRRSNAGMNAMIEAVRRGHDKLFCLGFDFLIEDSPTACHTMYDGTPGYDPARRATEDDNLHRTKYLSWFAEQNPMVSFVFVFPRAKMTLRTVEAPNIHAMYYDDFEGVIA
jgi:hypothetical protein